MMFYSIFVMGSLYDEAGNIHDFLPSLQ